MTKTKPLGNTTSALWDAVGGQATYDVLARMKDEGWEEESSSDGKIRTIVLTRRGQHATLYIANEKVAMVQMH